MHATRKIIMYGIVCSLLVAAHNAQASWLQDLLQNLFNSDNKPSLIWVPAGIITISALLMRNLYKKTRETDPMQKKESKVSTEHEKKPLPKENKKKNKIEKLVPKTSTEIVLSQQPKQKPQPPTVTSSVATLFNSPKTATSFVQKVITINGEKYNFFGLYQGWGRSGVQLIDNLKNYLHHNIGKSKLSSVEDAIQEGVKKTGGQLIPRNTGSSLVLYKNKDEIDFANIGGNNPHIVVIDKKNNIIVLSKNTKNEDQEGITHILITTPTITDLLKKIGKYQRYQENPREPITPTTPEVLQDFGTQTNNFITQTGFSSQTAQTILNNINDEKKKLPQSKLNNNEEENMALMIIKIPEIEAKKIEKQ
jgi:hypothetical protein